MPNGRVGGRFFGPGARGRRPVFEALLPRDKELAQTERSFMFEHSEPFICLFPACSHRLLQLFVKGPAIGRYNNEHVINYGHDSHLRESYR